MYKSFKYFGGGWGYEKNGMHIPYDYFYVGPHYFPVTVKNLHFYYSTFLMKTIYQSKSQAHYKSNTNLKAKAFFCYDQAALPKSSQLLQAKMFRFQAIFI